MIIAIDGLAASGVLYSFPAIFASLASCHLAAVRCALAPANLAIGAILAFGIVAGVLARGSYDTAIKRWANLGMQTSFAVWLVTTAVIAAFYWRADPINAETEYPSLGLYFDLANWIFGLSLLMLAGFAGLRLGLLGTQGSGAAS